MEYVTMAEGLEFSRVVLGFWRLLDWNLSTDELIRYLEECLDLGITTMDHADIYGDYTVEEKFGEAMKKKAGSQRRNADHFKVRNCLQVRNCTCQIL